ncbi:MAG: SGNH/GDSL hydrolase family protein [Balneolaceae bacterium]|nr:MAG: SGNH/GDSL hydrolase family protein [Balneolaceae bacterium]
MKKFGEHIAFGLIGIIFALFLAEIIVRVLLPQNRMVTWIEMHPNGFMMNVRNLEALHHTGDRINRYRLNEFGLRGDQFTHEADDYRILLIGDSFTFGLYLEEQHTFSTHLSRFASNDFSGISYTFLNGGIGGAGLADWPGWLNLFGNQINPDLVIYFLNTADSDRAISKNLFVLDESESTLLKSQRWEPRNIFINMGRQSWYRWLQEKSHVMNIVVRFAWRHLYFKDLTYNFDPEKSRVVIPETNSFYPDSGYSKNLSYKIIEKMHHWCKNNHCDFLVTTTGFFDETHTEPHTNILYQSFQYENLSFPFFDNTKCMMQRAGSDLNSFRIPEGEHPDENGAMAIAECTWQWLRSWLNENTVQK